MRVYLLLCLFISTYACESEDKCELPTSIIELELNDLYSQAVNDWYYLNLNSNLHDPTYLVEHNEEIENYIYRRDSVRNVLVLDRDKTSDYETMKSLFSENVFRYSESKLYLFEMDGTQIIDNDTILFTLFPAFNEESYVVDFNSSFIYNLFYVKDSLIRVGIGDYYELDISVDRSEVNAYIDSLIGTESGEFEFLKCLN